MIPQYKRTFLLFLVILPLHTLLPTTTYFVSILISSILIFLKYIPQKNIIAGISTLIIILFLMYFFPNFYLLFTTNVISLLILLHQLLPLETFLRIIEIILLILLLRYLLHPHTLLSISVIGVSALLRYDRDVQTLTRCYISYILLIVTALLVSLLVLPMAVFRPWDLRNIR